MLSVLGQVLPLAIGIALSPFPIIGLILILFTKQARTNSVMFLVGWLLGLAVVAAIVLALVNAGRITAGEETTQTGIKWGTLLLGLGLWVLALRRWRARPKAGEHAPTPKWMESLDAITSGKALGLGALLSGVNPKNLLLNVAAALAIAGANLDTSSTLIVTLVFILLSSITIIAPVLYVQIAGERAQPKLDVMKVWLIQHNTAIMAVLLLVIGAKLVGDGLALF